MLYRGTRFGTWSRLNLSTIRAAAVWRVNLAHMVFVLLAMFH